ncbi:stealth conserved region 3 domain-containing protein [Nocardioides sp. R-C-SC26]|uniref:stealth conserved region 3 domain-containing protein n=1 Tax=Nocardioides sp. R-C-SC26 TaxID=2870414 RepID=UPI001E63F16A|nr:stealth conserved region 3 domain-containing protein [Nocardioides sp. R-C-SC26]
MKVAFLIATVHDVGGTAGAVVTQANALVGRAEIDSVEIWSIYSTPPDAAHHFPIDPRVTVLDLVDLTAPDTGRTPLASVPSRLIPRGSDPGLDARADVALAARLPALDADVLVTVTPAMLAFATELAPARTAIVHQEHRSSSQRPLGRDLLLDRARRADVVAMLTEPMAAWLRRELGEECPLVPVVPNALPPLIRPRSMLTEPVILSAGRLASEKQWPHLVAAFGQIADRIPGWRLRIFGEGQTRFDVMGQVRKLGLWDRVELPGSTGDLAAEWARASIAALSSQPGEGFPLVIQEAMAAGVPVVAYDMPSGPRDEITDGVDGLLVAQGSQVGLAAALLRLADDAAERRRLGDAAYATAQGWRGSTIADRWVEIFTDAVALRRGATSRVEPLLDRPVQALPDQDAPPPGREATGVAPARSRAEILRALAAIAERVSPEWWYVVPPQATPAGSSTSATLVLPMATRRAFLAELSRADAEGRLPRYAGLLDPDRRGWPARRTTAGDGEGPLSRGRTGRLRVEPWPGTAPARTLLAHSSGVTVDFWEEGTDDTLHATGSSVLTAALPRELETVKAEIDGVVVRTLPLLAAPRLGEVRFPVDAVFTWVDGADPVWETARARRLGASSDRAHRSERSSGRARYADRGELRYSMRGLHLFAPWVRTIHVVTAGQVPAWLDASHPAIHLVDHREILPAAALPTFNSHAIEAAVHRIEGLAEHFVYLNDDFFLGRPTWPERFFDTAGRATVFPSSTLIGLPGQLALPWAQAADNNRRLLQEAFGHVITTTLAHAPYAHRVSTLRAVAERFTDAVEATMHSPFRSASDVSMLSSLGQHYGLLDGTAVARESDFAFVDLSEAIVRRRLKALLARDREGFCLADAHSFARDPAQVDALVVELLEEYFPIAAPWER